MQRFYVVVHDVVPGELTDPVAAKIIVKSVMLVSVCLVPVDVPLRLPIAAVCSYRV